MPAISRWIACAIASAVSVGTAAQDHVMSVHSPLTGVACSVHVDQRATGAQTLDCPGAYGYRLRVIEDDQRRSVNVVTPGGHSFALNYWDVVTRGFSTLGSRAEWRIQVVDGAATPFAVIVRVNALDQRDAEHPRTRPLLVVARISRDAACVTHLIDAALPNAARRARSAAAEVHVPCLHDTVRSKKTSSAGDR